MKNYYFLLIFLFSTTTLAAQQFSTQFYFTDTLGNQDTVTVGFDPVATRGVDAVFGEVDMKEVPFGEELEVRVGQINDEILSCFPGSTSFGVENIDNDQNEIIIRNGKRELSGLSCNNGVLEYLDFYGRTTFFLKNSAFPIHISWDNSVFTNTCINQTIVTDWHPNFWFDLGDCASFFEELGDITELSINEPTYVQVIDRSGDTLSMIHLKWDGDFTSSTKDQTLPTFNTFPNPAQDQLTIQFSDRKIRPWKLINVNGKIVKKGAFNSAVEEIQLEELTNGIYFLQITGFKTKRLLVGTNW